MRLSFTLEANSAHTKATENSPGTVRRGKENKSILFRPRINESIILQCRGALLQGFILWKKWSLALMSF